MEEVLPLGRVEECPRLVAAAHRLVALACATERGARDLLPPRAGSEGAARTLVGAERDDRAAERDSVTALRPKVLRASGRLGRLREHGVWLSVGGWYPAREPSRPASQPLQELQSRVLIMRSPMVRPMADAGFRLKRGRPRS
jgi:hypothetical protein